MQLYESQAFIWGDPAVLVPSFSTAACTSSGRLCLRSSAPSLARRVIIVSSMRAARPTSFAVPTGPEILEGCPPGQVDAARQMLQKQGIEIVYNAMVSCIHLNAAMVPSSR